MKKLIKFAALLLAAAMMITVFASCGGETDNALINTYWYSESDSIALYFRKNGTVELYAMENETNYLAKVDGTYSVYEDCRIKIVYTNSEPITGTYGVANGKLMIENDNGTTTLYTALETDELKMSSNQIPTPGETGSAETTAPIEVEDYSSEPEKFVTLGEYKGAELDAVDRNVYDNEINTQLAKLINEKTIGTIVTDRAVKEGDIVNITFNAYVDEFLQSGESAENTVAFIGNGDYIEGFEEGLIGLMPGTERNQLYLKFPDDYANIELAGREVRYAVNVNYIIEYTEADLNDSSKTGYESYDTMIADFKVQITEYKELLAKYQRINAAWNYANENAVFTSMPEGAVESYYNDLVAYYTYYAAQNGMTVDQYAEKYFSMTLEELQTSLTASAENVIKSQILVYAIAKAENIEISEEEYQTRAMEYAEQDGYTTIEEAEAAYGKDALYVTVLRDIVMETLGDYAVEVAAK